MLETVEWVLPSVLRVFTSGDKVVVFDPATAEDEAQAAQETDITNYYALKANKGKGFLALHDWFKDALMFPNGYIKAYIKESIHTDVGNITGVDAVGLQMLVDDEDVEILEQESRTILVEAPAAPMQPPMQGGNGSAGPGQMPTGQPAPGAPPTGGAGPMVGGPSDLRADPNMPLPFGIHSGLVANVSSKLAARLTA